MYVQGSLLSSCRHPLGGSYDVSPVDGGAAVLTIIYLLPPNQWVIKPQCSAVIQDMHTCRAVNDLRGSRPPSQLRQTTAGLCLLVSALIL